MTPKHIIYGLVDPRTLLVRYIGLSSNGMDRPWEHTGQSRLKGDRTYRANWLRSLLRVGLRPTIVILQASTKDTILQDEIWWIAYGRALGWRLTNLTKGGEGTFGYPKSAAARAKLSAALKGRPKDKAHREKLRLANLGKVRGPEDPQYTARRTASLKGRKRTAEQVERMRQAQRARFATHVVSDETRAKMRAAHIGRPRPPEVGEKVRAALLGRPKSAEHRARLAQATRDYFARKRAAGGQ